MKDSIKDTVVWYFTVGLGFVILIGGGMVIYPNYQRMQELKRDNAELREKIEEKQRQTESLINMQRRFQSDPDFVEQIARQNHRVLPGELVFIFEKE